MFKAYDFCKFVGDEPQIRGHAGPINDFEFSPFNDSLLATASDDASIKLWIIPEEGVTQDIVDSDGDLKGHLKKVIFTKFHPSADFTIASASSDMTVRLWDVQQQKCVSVIEESKGQALGLEWSHNGSLLASITKDKTAYIFDPRKEGTAMSAKTHEGARQ